MKHKPHDINSNSVCLLIPLSAGCGASVPVKLGCVNGAGWRVEVFMCLDISVCAYSELVFHSIKQWWLVPSIYPRVGAEQRRARGENKKVPHPTQPLSWPRPHGGELRSITISNQATPHHHPAPGTSASAHSDMTPTYLRTLAMWM